MDSSERAAEFYLQSLAIGSVEYEPDGNTPPDFLLDGRIAVEVRRLNQHHELPGGAYEGLEQRSIRLLHWLKNHFHRLGPSRNGECWYACIKFSRPLPDLKSLRPLLDAALRSFMANPDRRQTTIQITPSFTVDLLRSGLDHGSFFTLGVSSDNDAGGWVMDEVARNLRLCIAEKERKIAPYRARYDSWWLVLTDHIDYSIDQEDRETFRAEVMPSIPHAFDKIVLIDPTDHTRAFEAYSSAKVRPNGIGARSV